MWIIHLCAKLFLGVSVTYIHMFSLYCRTSIPSKSIKYAIFLLNQNIAQLCYDITGLRCDMRSTLENINQIFIFLSETQNSDQSEQKKSDVYINKSFTPSFNSYKNASNGCAKAATNQLSRSQSSVDINNMPFPLTTAAPHNFLLQLPNSIPLSIEGDSILKQR
ncbi:PREDICTED: UV radiation resistance-associated gene protein, partial [Rhagoletis zephyria]